MPPDEKIILELLNAVLYELKVIAPSIVPPDNGKA